ncbi:hypothetical protein [Intrasporangium sp.]|uniref:hypothetical protein n=1 Tax=Intrasporangium sp. TaxID=1925024 RepID=UPI002939581F|nr:hypothetical protein [Intrasporangium sp.]MDV3222969.1 hypothetical protein [Intrasporangium sp.]
MNDEHLRDLLLRAQDSLPTVGFDPAEDLVRARQARTRRWVARTGVGATAAVVGAALALSIIPRAGDALGGLTPAGGGFATVASTAAASVETQAAEPTTTARSATKGAALTTEELGTRMEAAIRTHAAGSDDYLRPRHGNSSGSYRDEFYRFGIHATWAKQGEKSLGGIRVVSSAATDPEKELREPCGGTGQGRLEPGQCALVDQRGGNKIHYGSTDGTRAASITYADGRQVWVIAVALQGESSLTPTTAPLPTKEELIAIVSEPGLAWPGKLADTSGILDMMNSPAG